MSNVIFEIGAEEIPADYLAGAVKNIKENLEKQLLENRVNTTKISVFFTVRRFIIYLEGVEDKQPDLAFLKKGPAYDMAYTNGALNELGKTFVNKNNIKESDLQFKEEKGKKYLYIEGVEKGRAVEEVLREIFPAIISGIKFPKSMTWDDSGVTFARPVRWLLALINSKVLEFGFGKLKSANKTRLHKFLHDNKEVVVKDAPEYFKIMTENEIEVVPETRRAKIETAIENMLKEKNMTMIKDEDLMRRVADSVETAAVMTGEFDKKYLFLPEAVIVTAMREHQRYFAVKNAKGEFTNIFVNARDGGHLNTDAIVKAHAKVLASRLSDAEFFYKEDLKKPLEDNLTALKDSTFIAGLGTMYDKTLRIKGAAEKAENIIKYKNPSAVSEAAYLAKMDLGTNMVAEKEFISLRGFMGGVYLEKQGHSEAVCNAVSEHYFPNFVGDKLPATETGVVISLIDKLDNIVGFFIAGFKPTGSKDPYAVRRQALTAIYIVTEKKLDLDLSALIKIIATEYKTQQGKTLEEKELTEFFAQREINYFKDKALDYDIINAVVKDGTLEILNHFNRTKLLMEKRAKGPEFNTFVFAMSRVSNILKDHKGGAVNESLFEQAEEKELWKKFSQNKKGFIKALEEKNNKECLKIAEDIEEDINKYFDKVLVNCDVPAVKENRLNALAEIKNILFKFADYSEIVIDRA